MELSKFIAVNKIHFTEYYNDFKTVYLGNYKIFIGRGIGGSARILVGRQFVFL